LRFTSQLQQGSRCQIADKTALNRHKHDFTRTQLCTQRDLRLDLRLEVSKPLRSLDAAWIAPIDVSVIGVWIGRIWPVKA
jgi:hypothetical protein